MAGFPQNVLSPIFLALLGIMSAALVVSIYHWVVFGRCRPGRRGDHIQAPSGAPSSAAAASASAEGGEDQEASSSTCLVPPACTYGKGEGMVGGGESSTCSVCLCDFKDGEQVRLLPECMHYYHASCIDKWLRSHTSCPMCRAETTPPPPPPPLCRPASGRQLAPADYGRTPG